MLLLAVLQLVCSMERNIRTVYTMYTWAAWVLLALVVPSMGCSMGLGMERGDLGAVF